MEKIKIYNNSQKANKDQESLAVKTLTVKMGIHRDLGLDSMANKPYTEDEIARVELCRRTGYRENHGAALHNGSSLRTGKNNFFCLRDGNRTDCL